MHEFDSQLQSYQTKINTGIAVRAVVSSILLFAAGFHLYLIMWYVLGAYHPALVYANIAIRMGLVLSIIYVIWVAYKGFWTPLYTARYLDHLHNAQDDLYQNALEIYEKHGNTPISVALKKSASQRLKDNKYPLPKVFGSTLAFVIPIIFLCFIALWLIQKEDSFLAIKQFYSNKPPELIYKETVELSPGNVSIGKNQQLLIKVIEPDMRLEHKLFYRVGESWRELSFNDNSYLFEKLEHNIEYYAENKVAKSPVYNVRVLDMPIVRKWHAAYNYPAYTRVPARSDSMSYGNLEGYIGTEVTLRINTNVPVVSAEMVFEDASRKELGAQDSQSFITQIRIDRPRRYYIELEDELGRKNRPEEKQIKVLSDMPPEIRFLLPAEDVILNQNMKLPLIIAADDDFGLKDCRLMYQLNGGEVQAVNLQGIIDSKIFNKEYLWDLGFLELFPSDVVTYWAEIYDNAPSPQKGETSKYRARFPSIEEIYSQIESQDMQNRQELDRSLEESRKLQEEFEQKRRELLKDPDLSWEDKQELQSMLEQQEMLLENVDQIAEDYQDLIEKLQENSALSHETLQKMMRIQELMEEIATSEMWDALSKMQDAMDKISPEDLKKAMEDFKFSMEDFAQKIEQTLALLESIKNEQAMEKALQIAQEMEKLQHALNEKTKAAGSDNQKLAEDQAQIQEKYENLKRELEELSQNLKNNPSIKEQMDSLLEDMQSSQPEQDMQRSRQSLMQDQTQAAISAQEELLSKMRRFTMMISKMKDAMGSDSSAAMKAGIERAIRELLILSKNHELTKAAYDNDPYAILPKLIAGYEGLQISLNMLFSTPQVSLVLPPKFFIDLTDTNNAYRKIFSVLGQANIPNILSDLQKAQRGLNLMAHDLILAMDNSSGGGSGGGMDSLMQMLEQMGQEQMAMNMLTEQLMMQMQAQGGKMDDHTREQIEKLASEQERLAENLKRALSEDPEAQKQGNALKKIIEEIESVTKQLKSNNITTDTLKQQENILSRLLDAQKSITKRDHSERREAIRSQGMSYDRGKTVDYDRLRRSMMSEDSFKSYPREYQELIMEYLKLLQEAQ
ncbi:MAG: hypothetical protein LHW60_01165 [Candidatus Cloacimonetes bacterium]|nr:hypothetical protein [Candidatus Cloacimonadota bacterium]